MQPFFYSWTKQQEAVHFPVQSARDDSFVLENGDFVFDFVSTSFQANFGHSFAPIRQRIQQQLDTMPVASPKSSFPLKARVSQSLLELLNLGAGKIFYTVSGAESVENALKIARQIKKRPIILARQKSYHGASLGALSVTGDWRNDPHLTFDEGTVRIPEPQEDPELKLTRSIVQSTGPENIAAIILETISGTNGMCVPSQEWFERVEELCREFDLFLISDEVLVGFGRCGPDFAFQKYGIRPDLVCLSKAITGGYVPFGAVWTSSEIADYYDSRTLACGLTNYAHPLGLAALEGVLESLRNPEFLQIKQDRENLFGQLVQELSTRPGVLETRCEGMMAAIELDHPACSWQEAFEAGLHLFCKSNLIILAPPYNCGVDRLEKSMQTLTSLL